MVIGDKMKPSKFAKSDQSFPKHFRLLSTPQFKAVYKTRCSVADDLLVVYGRQNGLEYSRLGLSVSRKVGNAVFRNRWKRFIREAFRTNQHKIPPGYDFVVIPRVALPPGLVGVQSSLLALTNRVTRRLKKAK